jgi:hypothetical protein
MAALDFPLNPSAGQQYTLNGVNYYYDSVVGAWLTSVVGNPIITSIATVSGTTPATANVGDIWFNTSLSKLFVYYDDGSSSQWVEPSYAAVFPDQLKVNTSFTVANAAFGVANGGYTVANAAYTQANAAYTAANTRLANTSGTVFSGNLTITGTTTVGNTVTLGGVTETRVAMAANDINLLAGSYFTKTIGSATTLTVSNIPTTGNVASFILDLTNGGAGTITWWSGAKFPSNTAPTLTASGRDVLGFFTHDGGTTWSGLVLGKDIR